jgi:hypothetical protein
MGESQPGQAPLHWTRPGVLKHLSQVIPTGKTGMAQRQPTWRGVKETSRLGLRYEAQGCWVPSMGLQMHQLQVTLYVASSLALVTLGGFDPTSGFQFRTLSIGRSMATM